MSRSNDPTLPARGGGLQLAHPAADRAYSLELTARLAGVARRTVLLYCRAGLIQPTADPNETGFWFGDDAVHTIRRAERLRLSRGLRFDDVRLIFQLLDELERLRRELNFYRGL